MKKIFVLCALISFFYSCNNPKTGNGTPDLSGNTTGAKTSFSVATSSPLNFVEKITIPASGELNFNPKKIFSENKSDNPITKFKHSDSFKELYFDSAQVVPANQPSFNLLVFETTGDTFKIDTTEGTPLSEIEYSRALCFFLSNQIDAKTLSPNFFLVRKSNGAIVNLSSCWNSIVDHGWLLVGNTNTSCGKGFYVFLKKR